MDDKRFNELVSSIGELSDCQLHRLKVEIFRCQDIKSGIVISDEEWKMLRLVFNEN